MKLKSKKPNFKIGEIIHKASKYTILVTSISIEDKKFVYYGPVLTTKLFPRKNNQWGHIVENS